MKIVASMTTMPNRIDLIRITLDSLRNQSVPIDHIEINIPYKCVRTGEDYVIPEWLENYPNLEIYRTEDYGAITKVAPTLIRYRDDEETYVWSVDDDIDYSNITLSVLLRQHNPSIKRILAYSVGSMNKGGFIGNIARADYGILLEGYGTVLYPPRCIGEDFLSHVEITSAIPDCKVSDDVILSNYFYGRGIRPFCCPEQQHEDLRIFNKLLPYYKDATATHLQTGGHRPRYIRVLHKLKELGMLYWTMELPQLIKSMAKTTPPQRQPTNHTAMVSRRQVVHTPLTRPAVLHPQPQSNPVKHNKNFALTGSSAKAGKRFYG
jgi:hypothetical protein